MNQFWKASTIQRTLYSIENAFKMLYIAMTIFKYQASYIGFIPSVLGLFRRKSFQNDFALNILYLVNLSLFECTRSLMFHLPVVLHYFIGIGEYVNMREGFLLEKCRNYVKVAIDYKESIYYFRCQFELMLVPIIFFIATYLRSDSNWLFILHILYLITKYFANEMMVSVLRDVLKQMRSFLYKVQKQFRSKLNR